MISEIFLTNENYVRGLTLIDNNVQSKFILSSIREAQEVGLQEIVGSKLLKKLKTLVVNGDIDKVENTAYKELVNESQLYLAYKAVSILCLVTNVKVSNGGLQQTSDENLTTLNVSDTFIIQKHYEDKADYFAQRLQSYIQKNIAHYPEVIGCENYEIHPTLDSAASTGVFLGGRRGFSYRGGRWNKFGTDYIGK